MYDQTFFSTLNQSGVGFEEFLDSYRASVPDFKANFYGGLDKEFHWRSEAISGAGVTLLVSKVSSGWTAERETGQQALSLLIPMSQTEIEARIGSKKVFAKNGEAILAPMSHMREFGCRSAQECSGIGFFFDKSILSKVLDPLCKNANVEDLNLAPILDLSTGLGTNFSMILQSLAMGMRSDRPLEKSPKSMVLLAEAALLFLLGNVPNALQSHVNEQPSTVMPVHIRNAIDYMNANIDRQLTMTEIANSVGISVRSLRQGFLQHKNMTPRHYLRRIRLDAVHAELMQPCNTLPVSTVAMKWGFSHVGRFATQYEAAYGVAPSETVRNAKKY